LNAFMKSLLALIATAGLAGGCAVVPLPAEPVVYAAPPPPVVVVRPHAYYGYYRGGPYWRRGWR
jgi:hypothetical protein